MSGDGQEAVVTLESNEASTFAAPVAPRTQDGEELDDEAFLPDPLVAQLVADEDDPDALLAPAGPSYAMVPDNATATYEVLDDDCGEMWVGTIVPDDSGYVTDR